MRSAVDGEICEHDENHRREDCASGDTICINCGIVLSERALIWDATAPVDAITQNANFSYIPYSSALGRTHRRLKGDLWRRYVSQENNLRAFYHHHNKEIPKSAIKILRRVVLVKAQSPSIFPKSLDTLSALISILASRDDRLWSVRALKACSRTTKRQAIRWFPTVKTSFGGSFDINERDLAAIAVQGNYHNRRKKTLSHEEIPFTCLPSIDPPSKPGHY